MSLEQLNTLDAVKQFLDGTQAVAFNVATGKAERYRWVQKTLVKHRYLTLGKLDRGTITRYLIKVTSYSLAQTKRLIRQYVKAGVISIKPARRNGFERAYTDADIRLLASMDERHDQPSGAVIKKLCERAYQRFGQAEYQRVAGISVSHLYNLRASKTYQRQRCTLTKTRPKASSIGQRRKPCPNDQPGYIRIDSVHQGDQDKRKAELPIGREFLRGVHNLKHTFGRRLDGADVPYHLRQVLLGHMSKDVTEHYSAVQISRLVDAANSILDNPHDSPTIALIRRRGTGR